MSHKISLPDESDKIFKNFMSSEYKNLISSNKEALFTPFTIKNKIYKLDGNEGRNTLHGGKIGFDRLEWKIHHHLKTKIIYKLLKGNYFKGYKINKKNED